MKFKLSVNTAGNLSGISTWIRFFAGKIEFM